MRRTTGEIHKSDGFARLPETLRLKAPSQSSKYASPYYAMYDWNQRSSAAGGWDAPDRYGDVKSVANFPVRRGSWKPGLLRAACIVTAVRCGVTGCIRPECAVPPCFLYRVLAIREQAFTRRMKPPCFRARTMQS
jgi:hypothetical protein